MTKKIGFLVLLHDQRGVPTVMLYLTRVESISIDSKEKKLTITGNIDAVSLVSKLRKLCHTDIVSVGPAKAGEEEGWGRQERLKAAKRRQ
ncbi:hypothetical protein HAX54_008469 [Datura stramonium]|uniref:HMA domain-containing protein n=1 Tax=Datura stramonium TaxID=4076 RepID=A0ABS8TDE5_DATST|nr:hypothetical protein [Datura stramonium]